MKRSSLRPTRTALAAVLALSAAAGCDAPDAASIDDLDAQPAPSTSLATTAAPVAPLAVAPPTSMAPIGTTSATTPTAPGPIWSAGFEGYPAFTVLNPAAHAAQLTNEKLNGWQADGVRLTVVTTPPMVGFSSGKALLADGLQAGTSYPALSFGGFGPSTLPPFGEGNGADVAVLSFDAWFEVAGGADAAGYVELGTDGPAKHNLVQDLAFPARRMMRVTVVANRSPVPVRLPDFDNDGEVDDNETLEPDQAFVYYRTTDGAYATARPAPVDLESAAYDRIDWHLRYGNVSAVIYDDFQLANDAGAELGGVALLEMMPGRAAPPVDAADPDAPTNLEIAYDETNIETFEPVIPLAQSAAMRQAFDWAQTSAWPEGSEEAPALFYSMIYVDDPEVREALDEMEVHWDALPLFASEMDAYRGRVGIFDHLPDSLGGHWVYAFLPGSVYNTMREEALAGNASFSAVLRRDVPDASALNPDGSISYKWLADQGLFYSPDVVEDAAHAAPEALLKPYYDDAEAAANAPAGAALKWHPGRRLKHALKKIVDKGKDVVNKVRETVTDGLKVVTPNRSVDIDLSIYNTDEQFDPATQMVRAWSPDEGTPLTLPGIEVRVRQGKVLLNRGRLSTEGKVHVSVIKGLRTDICLVMSNHAAELTTFLIETRVCDFSGSNLGRVKHDRHVTLKVRNGFATVLAQMTDAYEYMRRIEGKTMHKAMVLVGPFANLFSGGASYAPCFDFFNARLAGEGVVTDLGLITLDTALAGAGLPPPFSATPIYQFVKLVTGVDIIIRDDSKHNRVPTHEYGHFAMCSMMYSENLRLFTNVNADIINRTVAGGRDRGDDVLALNEGFADYIAAQVAGGVNYWIPAGSANAGAQPVKPMHYCDPTTASCIDDNVGGTAGSEQHASIGGLINQKSAQATTYMIDVADGDDRNADRPNNGAAWELHNGKLRLQTSNPLLPAQDEPVALGRHWLESFIHNLAKRRLDGGVTWRLDRPEFYKALNDLIKSRTSQRIACDLCELHLDNDFCDRANFSTFACTTFQMTTTVTGTGRVTSSTAGLVHSSAINCTASGGASCKATYDKNTSVTLTAVPGTGQHFLKWTGNCNGVTTPTCTLSMTQARNVGAQFETNVVMVTLKIIATGYYATGTVTSSPAGITCSVGGVTTSCTKQFPAGTHIVLTGTKNDSHFLNWDSVCQNADNTKYKCVFDITQNTTIVANFWKVV